MNGSFQKQLSFLSRGSTDFFSRLTEQSIPDKDEYTPGVDVEAVDTERGEVLTNLHQGQVDEECYQTNKYEVERSTQCCDVVLTLQSKVQ